MDGMKSDMPPAAVAVSIVIPCCNEEASISGLELMIPRIVKDLSCVGPVEVVLVDDGSTDATWEHLTRLAAAVPAVRLARHEMNAGLGAALRTGFHVARGNVVVTTDADGTYPFAEIPALFACLTPGVDIVTASPYHPDGSVDGVPAWRLVFSRGASWCYRAVLGKRGRHIHTYTSLFRAYRHEVLPQIQPDHDGFLGVAEILVRAVLAGYTVAEYPTTLRNRRFGQSKARVLRITRSHLILLAALLTQRVRTRPPQGLQTVLQPDTLYVRR